MTELTFTAGERATLDLRDSRGDVVIQDGEGPTIRVASGDDRSPFVLRDQDTFRVRLDAGGSITLPATLPVEVVVPAVVRLRVTRTGGETIVKPAEPATAEGGAAPPPPPSPADLSEFARVMSEQGRRIFSEMTDRVRTGGSGVSDDVARRLDEAAGRIDEQVQHVAERVEREVERAFAAVERAAQRAEEHGRRAAGHGRRTAERAEEHGRRAAERAQRHAERAARRAGRGRWWFTEKFDDFAGASGRAGVGAGAWAGARGDSGPAPQPEAAKASPEERRVILEMLASGKITADQASTLLDALGG